MLGLGACAPFFKAWAPGGREASVIGGGESAIQGTEGGTLNGLGFRV